MMSTPEKSRGPTDRCNTGLQSIRWSLKFQRFSWPLIQTQSDFVQLGLRVAGQVRRLSAVLPIFSLQSDSGLS
jgi:hypothetical protein